MYSIGGTTQVIELISPGSLNEWDDQTVETMKSEYAV